MPKLSQSELAQSYGFALAFLKQDKSLWKLFSAAVKDDWPPPKFVAELRNISWYKKNGETVRQYQLLKSTDPATLRQRRLALNAEIGDAANQMGAVMSAKAVSTVTENALMFGWNDAQLRNVLATYVKQVNGMYQGASGDALEDIRQTAYRNGVRLSKGSEQAWMKNIAEGGQTSEFFQRRVRQLAKSVAPGFAEELDAGMDLWDIADSYMQSKAKILEVDPATIDLFDNDIRGALSGTTKDGKPATKSLWQFEQEMRKKPAWLKTQNAQDSVMSVAKKVLTDFGFQGV